MKGSQVLNNHSRTTSSSPHQCNFMAITEIQYSTSRKCILQERYFVKHHISVYGSVTPRSCNIRLVICYEFSMFIHSGLSCRTITILSPKQRSLSAGRIPKSIIKSDNMNCLPRWAVIFNHILITLLGYISRGNFPGSLTWIIKLDGIRCLPSQCTNIAVFHQEPYF